MVTIAIEDNGIGIPKDALRKLGRPFEQVESQLTKRHQGSGLGLAIAKSLAELHGGAMRIRSVLGTGTMVVVRLPLEARPPARARERDCRLPAPCGLQADLAVASPPVDARATRCRFRQASCARIGMDSPMPQKIKTGFRALVDDAEREIETLSVEDAIALHGRDDVTFIDVRDIRELEREGRMPGAFHCPRGMLEFWIDPESPYHKPIFARGQALRVFLRRRLAFGARGANRASDGPRPVAHIKGGFGAWRKASGPLEPRRKPKSARRVFRAPSPARIAPQDRSPGRLGIRLAAQATPCPPKFARNIRAPGAGFP